MSKGSKRRPPQVSREELDLRWAYATGTIGHHRFDWEYAKLKREGLLRRRR